MDEKEFTKGFNQGYLFQKHRPALASKIRESLKESQKESQMGFVAGAEEYRMEQVEKYLAKDHAPPPALHRDANIARKPKDKDRER